MGRGRQARHTFKEVDSAHTQLGPKEGNHVHGSRGGAGVQSWSAEMTGAFTF